MHYFCFVFLFPGTEVGPQVSQERGSLLPRRHFSKTAMVSFQHCDFFFLPHLRFPQSQLHIAEDCAHLWGMGICVRQTRDQFSLTRHLSSGKTLGHSEPEDFICKIKVVILPGIIPQSQSATAISLVGSGTIILPTYSVYKKRIQVSPT